jgi:uncharacterized protein YajQ (UPF0234 family)
MASEHSFDISCETDLQEVDNAINMAMKEIRQRFDFKGSVSDIKLDKSKGTIQIISDDEYKLKSVIEILMTKLVKRNVSTKAIAFGNIEKAAGNTVKQIANIQQGIPQDKAKEIVKIIKNSKIKVNASVQDDKVRVKGKKIDDLQKVISILKNEDFDIELQFVNFR